MLHNLLRSSLLLLVIAFALPAVAASQAAQAGRIAGRVVDASSGRPLAAALVTVQGASRSATTSAEGRYAIEGVPAGTHALALARLGYTPKTVTGVNVPAGGSVTTDVALTEAAAELEGITVTAERERGSVSRAMDEQRTALNVTSVVTREEIRRGPDDNAAEAVQRVSGVTVEGGRYVFVRGLGERYTTTELNGARLPSPEPDRRVVPLDLFPAGILESINVSKTFTPDQEGSFAGAQVNLRTRVFDSAPFTQFGASVGYNSTATFNNIINAPSDGVNFLGMAGETRRLPAGFDGTVGRTTDSQQAAILSSFRPVFLAGSGTALPNFSLSVSRGDAVSILGRELAYLGAFSYQRRQDARVDEVRATPTMRGTETVALNRYTANTGREGILWGGVLNLGMEFGPGSRLELNNTYDRTSDNEALQLVGTSEELGRDISVTRLLFVERSVLSNQLRGEHAWRSRHTADWSTTFSRVTRDEPDRSELALTRETNDAGQPVWAFAGTALAPTTRAFGELAEYSGAVKANYGFRFGGPSFPAQLKVGGLYRYTDRDATNKSFDFANVGLTLEERMLPPEQLFGGQFYDPANLGIRLRPNVFGSTYTANENLAAGYAMVDYPLTSRLNVVGGARLEWAQIEVDALDVVGQVKTGSLDKTDILPSLALNYRLTDRQNLRFSASQTLSRPEYRELADITYRDFVGDFLVFGNPNLERALIQNHDLRYESYPYAGEVMSVALFAKRFQDPIERVLIPQGSNAVVSFRNAREAVNYGVELELRRRLGFLAERLDALTAIANATLVRSEVDFGGVGGAEAATSQSRALLGQSPYVLNLGLSYDAPNEASATVLLNSVGRRITEVGLGGLPDAYEQSRTTLDLAVEYPLLGNATLRLEGENLLNAGTEIRQGELTRVQYRTGRSLSLGFSIRQQ